MDLKRPSSPGQERIPSYEESITQQQPQSSQSVSTPASNTLSSRIAASRTARIDALIVDAVLPRLHAQVEAGLTRTTTVLLPIDSAAAGAGADARPLDVLSNNLPDTAADAVIASGASVQDLLNTDQNITLLQLRGATHTAAFWSQPGADTALAGALRARLRAEGHRIAGDPEHSTLIPRPASPPVIESKKKGFWRRVANSASDQNGEGVGELHRPNAPTQGLAAGEVKIDVEVRDVAVRVCTELGLYESRTGTAIVVRVEIGGVEWSASDAGVALKN